MSSDNQAKRACVALSQSAKLNPKKNLSPESVEPGQLLMASHRK